MVATRGNAARVESNGGELVLPNDADYTTDGKSGARMAVPEDGLTRSHTF